MFILWPVPKDRPIAIVDRKYRRRPERKVGVSKQSASSQLIIRFDQFSLINHSILLEIQSVVSISIHRNTLRMTSTKSITLCEATLYKPSFLFPPLAYAKVGTLFHTPYASTALVITPPNHQSWSCFDSQQWSNSDNDTRQKLKTIALTKSYHYLKRKLPHKVMAIIDG